MNGSVLCSKLSEFPSLARVVMSNSQGKHACLVYFDFLGVEVAEGGGRDESLAEEAMAVVVQTVKDLLEVAESDPELAEMYDPSLLKMLIELSGDQP